MNEFGNRIYVRVTASPFAQAIINAQLSGEKDGMDSMPEWIGQACVGLRLPVYQGSSISFFVFSDDLIEALNAQQPQTRSAEATAYIKANDSALRGSIKLTADFLEILTGPGGQIDIEATTALQHALVIERRAEQEARTAFQRALAAVMISTRSELVEFLQKRAAMIIS